MKQVYYLIQISIDRYFILSAIAYVIGSLLTIHVFFVAYDWFSMLSAPSAATPGIIETFRTWLIDHRLLYPMESFWLNAMFLLVLILFFPAGRKLIFFIFKQIWKFLAFFPGETTREYFRRYMNIGRFSFYTEQSRIFGRLSGQYPAGTQFILLPMDMEFMAAGKPPGDFYTQMQELAEIKDNHKKTALPFVFVDPRRITSDPNFFRYHSDAKTGKIILEPCFIKTYIEELGFSGFKIYPALGYYPFDARLLPLWKYAAENDLPILTHCIRGTIFYRGIKAREWDFHPVFKQVMREGEYTKLLLPEIKNKDFCNNFTHPLNYLCLLEPSELMKVLARHDTPQQVRDVFGYKENKLSSDLKNLKICMGHFGGDDEWKRYFEQDRHDHSIQLSKHPHRGIDFFATDGEPRPGKIEQLWKYTDWYSIICSMMLKYENVYSDISYIVHSEEILPLLKKTLMAENEKLRSRVLFGTDFYVVRNHKSEKNMLADMLMALTEEEFDCIARKNPVRFLENAVSQK